MERGHDPDQPLPALPTSGQDENPQSVPVQESSQPRQSVQSQSYSSQPSSSQPERIQIITPLNERPLTMSTAERPLLEGSDGHSPTRNTLYGDHRISQPAIPPLARGREGLPRAASRRPTMMGPPLDYLVPAVEEKIPSHPERNITERLEPTIKNAEKERDMFAKRAMMTGYALNVAIGLQVVLGALTTGLSAATTGRQTSIMTAILGGMATIVASYLARTRGSNEPEHSVMRVKDLEQFIRDCKAFDMDHGPQYASKEPNLKLNDRLFELRSRLEELLGNTDGNRKNSPA
ncbi:hypothetical protein BJ138DRAFT_67436 [Hygrophoropsis aurantiaca]|uniref:Uncharacterized protein n=1 Tax=Hygrophoropsis aurantiaca TaxID=72124 RepID=A0ACB8ACH0_9AGAM|nr:hypothetical protein BJ138DRAFT_67436 [Hygrophoropsis aurantiaca]